MSQMLKASGALAAATMISRLLGMVREIVYARFMGDGWVAGAFQFAFMIPNLLRRLLGEGALTAAFVPIFKEKEKTAGDAEMWRAANAVISGLVVVAAAIVLVVVAGLSVALATQTFGAQTHLMLALLRVMFPYMLLVCVAAVFMAMLNARGHFFIPAIGATMLNVVMIASVLWLAPRMGQELPEQIFGLALGVLVAGAAQAAFQWPSLRREGFRYQWVAPWRDATVRRVVQQMIPGIIGVAAFHLNVLLTQGVAFWVDASIVATFNYAVRLMELPQGVFGISLATYLLPTLSGLVAEKKFDDYRTTLRQGIGLLVFVNLLASVLLVVLAAPTVRLLFERGQFTPDSTARVAWALECLAPGLIAFSLVNILARAFYALSDTKTPMKISVFCLGLNLMLALPLVMHLRQGGLGMAYTLSAGVNVALLVYALRRKLGHLSWGGLGRQFTGMALAGACAGVGAWAALWGWERWVGHGALAAKLGAVFVPATTAGLVYWAVGQGMKIAPAVEMREWLRQRLARPRP